MLVIQFAFWNCLASFNGAAISICSFKLELDLFCWNTFGDGRVTKEQNALTKIYIQHDGLLSPVFTAGMCHG